MAWQHHGAEVTRQAEPCGIVTSGTGFERCDGLWSDEPRPGDDARSTADCLPVALARARRRDAGARASCTSAGAACWPGSSTAGARALGGGPLAAAIGPGSAPAATRSARRSPSRSAPPSATRSSPTAGSTSEREPRQALRAAGLREVERTDLCTYCHPELFFSHRRDRGPDRAPGRRCLHRLRRVRANYERIRGELGPGRHDRRRDEVRRRRRAARRSPRPGSRSSGRTARRTSRRSTRATATPSAGTSSATCRAARRRPSTSSASSCHSLDASRRRGGSRSRRSSR